jgi:hypothetical protein
MACRNPFAEAFLEMSDPEKNRELPRDLSFREMVCRGDMADLPASDTQIALLLAADGKPIEPGLLSSEQMGFHFNAERLPPGRPSLVILRTGVRAAKSLIAALSLLYGALFCQFRRPPDPTQGERPQADGLIGVRSGEEIRALIVGPKLHHGAAPLEHIRGTMKNSPILRKYIHGNPDAAESITIKRPDGALVKIMKIAADKGGGNLRGTWLAGILFDEAAFHDDDEAAVNLGDNIDAILGRLLPGAQAWVVSSPWSEDDAFNRLFMRYYGKPGDALAFHSDTRSMNPAYPQADIDRVRRYDPDKAQREFDALPLAAGNKAFFPLDAIEKSFDPKRALYLTAELGVPHTAGVDFGFTKNSSALAIARPLRVIVDGEQIVKAQLVYHEEKRPDKGVSLKPSEVVRDFARKCKEYRVRRMQGDHHSKETAYEELGKLREEDRTFDIVYDAVSQQPDEIGERFAEMRRLMQEGLADLPDDPVLRKQLEDTRSRVLPGGRIGIVVPKHGARHGDVMQAAILALVQVDLSVKVEKKSKVRGQREMNNTGGF